jgi:hypothetical protein
MLLMLVEGIEEMATDGIDFEIIWMTFPPVSLAMNLTCRCCSDTMGDVAAILNVEVTCREEDVDGQDTRRR